MALLVIARAPRSRQPRRVAFAVAVLFGLSSIATYAAPATTSAWDGGAFSASSEADLVAMTNQSRASAGLKALKVDSTLKTIARWRSKDMIDRDYFSHDIPGYGKVFDKLNEIGYCYNVAGENIGWNNYPDDVATAAIHQAFMDSSGHRANILGKTYDVIGVGAYKGPTGKKMWTVLFADKCGSTGSTPTPKPTAKPKPKATARPTPRPTARPAARATTAPAAAAPPATAAPPAATPGSTPELIPDATPSLTQDDLVPPSDAATVPTDGTSSDAPALPGDAPADGTGGDGAVAMRVVDRVTSDGLLETIVGGVTGFFFGG